MGELMCVVLSGAKDLKWVSGTEMRVSSARNDGSKKEILRAKGQPSG